MATKNKKVRVQLWKGNELVNTSAAMTPAEARLTVERVQLADVLGQFLIRTIRS